MGSGAHINSTEDRAVMHVALRMPSDKQCFVDGRDVVPDVHQVLHKINAFAAKVRSKEWLGATGKPIRNVVSVGIGGSYLGPEFVYEALRADPAGRTASKGRHLRFLANVDPVDVFRAVEGLDPQETLVVVVSKTFTTAETMLNAKTLRGWLVSRIAGPQDEVIAKHMVAVRWGLCMCMSVCVPPHGRMYLAVPLYPRPQLSVRYCSPTCPSLRHPPVLPCTVLSCLVGQALARKTCSGFGTGWGDAIRCARRWACCPSRCTTAGTS